MKYDLAALVKARAPTRRASAQLPVISQSLALEKAYLALLRRLLQAAAQGIREIILPRYRVVTAVTTDADAASFDQFRLLLASLVRTTSEQLQDLLALEGRRHTKAWMAAAKRAFSIDLSSVVSEQDLGGYLEAAGLRNAGLIRGLTDDLVKRVQTETTNGVIAGRPVSELQVVLKEALGVSDSRAQLIARDQTSKVTADLNQIRHEQAGVDTYIWRTSQDERVRPRHRDLEGKVYKYGEPTGAEEGLPPGQPIRCRCIAQGVVEF